MNDEELVCGIPAPITNIVEVPVYIRVAVSAPSPEAAEAVGRAYVADFMVPDLRQTNMHWPVGVGTVMEMSVVPLCPGEDDTPDVFDATGEVKLYPHNTGG